MFSLHLPAHSLALKLSSDQLKQSQHDSKQRNGDLLKEAERNSGPFCTVSLKNSAIPEFSHSWLSLSINPSFNGRKGTVVVFFKCSSPSPFPCLPFSNSTLQLSKRRVFLPETTVSYTVEK